MESGRENVNAEGNVQRKCHLCNEIFPNKLGLIAHFMIHKGKNSPYLSQVAPINLQKQIDPEMKMKLYSSIRNKLFYCDLCVKPFPSELSLKWHMTQHTEEKPHVCHTCSIAFPLRNMLDCHLQIHEKEKSNQEHGSHDDSPPVSQSEVLLDQQQSTKSYSCNICSKTFDSLYQMRMHKISHAQERLHTCKLCNKVFKTKFGLKQHFQNHTRRESYHNGSYRSYRRNYCFNRNLKRHAKDKRYACRLCKKFFFLESDLEEHIMILHSNTSDNNVMCTEFFRSESIELACSKNLVKENQHLNDSELNVKKEKKFSENLLKNKKEDSLPIPDCGPLSKSSSIGTKNVILALKRRQSYREAEENGPILQTSHDAGKKELMGQLESDKTFKHQSHIEERQYGCHLCIKTFKHKYNLKEHLENHSGDISSYVCEFCDKSFSSKENFEKHISLHVEGNAHVCEICGESFTLERHLNSHKMKHASSGKWLKTHSADQCFRCEFCGKDFFVERHLEKHKIRMHSKKTNGSDCLRNECNEDGVHVETILDSTAQRRLDRRVEQHANKSSVEAHSAQESCNIVCGKLSSDLNVGVEDHKSDEFGDDIEFSEDWLKIEKEKKPLPKSDLGPLPKGSTESAKNLVLCSKNKQSCQDGKGNIHQLLHDIGEKGQLKEWLEGELVSHDACSKTFKRNKVHKDLIVQLKAKRCSCSVCKMPFNMEISVHDYFKTHTGEGLHVCGSCQDTYTSEHSQKTLTDLSEQICHKDVMSELNAKVEENEETNDPGEEMEFSEDWLKVEQENLLPISDPVMLPETTSDCTKNFTPASKIGQSDAEAVKDIEQTTHDAEEKALLGQLESGKTCDKTLKYPSEMHIQGTSQERTYACRLCNKVYSRNSDLEHHLKTHKRNTPPTCEICGRSFTASSTLKRHMMVHTERNIQVCDICGKLFANKWYLNKHHRKLHSQRKMFSCEICKKSFHNIKQHMKTHEAGRTFTPRTYQCHFCSKVFRKKNSLIMHLYKHTGNRPSYKCGLCKKSFGYRISLERHKAQQHSERKMYLCEICGKSFAQEQMLNTHNKRHHQGKQFSCNICNKAFGCKYHMERHVKTHLNSKWCICKFGEKCVCGERNVEVALETMHPNTLKSSAVGDKSVINESNELAFTVNPTEVRLHVEDTLDLITEQYLNQEIEITINDASGETHPGQESSNMSSENQCKQPETTSICIKDLLLMCEKEQTSQEAEKIEPTVLDVERTHLQGSMSFTCNFCSKTFNNLQRMLKHRRIHAPKKTYVCGICDRAFARKDNMKRHYKTHVLEDPYYCRSCKISVKSKESWKLHLALHPAGIKKPPFTCGICYKSFRDKQYMKQHIKIHVVGQRYTCALCQKHFFLKIDLEGHMKKRHPLNDSAVLSESRGSEWHNVEGTEKLTESSLDVENELSLTADKFLPQEVKKELNESSEELQSALFSSDMACGMPKKKYEKFAVEEKDSFYK